LWNSSQPKNDIAAKKNQPTVQPSNTQKDIAPEKNIDNNGSQQLAENNASTDNISTQKSNAGSIAKQPKTVTNSEVETTLQSLESSFINIINLQKAKISATPLYTEGPGYYNDFVSRLRHG